MNPHIHPCLGQIVPLLLFYKNSFGIKLNTKIGMLVNKGTLNLNIWNPDFRKKILSSHGPPKNKAHFKMVSLALDSISTEAFNLWHIN